MENHLYQIKWSPLNVTIIITHVRNLPIVMGATPMHFAKYDYHS